VRRPGNGGEGGGRESSGAGSLGARRSGGGAVRGGDAEAPFYRVGGGAGRPCDGVEWAAVVVRHDGGGGNHFGRGSARVVVGRDEGVGMLRPFWE
jgi:hypothetical protein